MGWLSITKFLLQMMPFQFMPCTNKARAAPIPTAPVGPWGAAADGGSPESQAAGATRVRLDRATLSPSVLSSVLLSFLLSLCFAVPRTVYCKCRYQIGGSDQLQVLNGCLEMTVCSFCYYYYCCRCSHYYLMLLFASGSISSQFPHPVLPPRQSICFAHPC